MIYPPHSFISGESRDPAIGIYWHSEMASKTLPSRSRRPKIDNGAIRSMLADDWCNAVFQREDAIIGASEARSSDQCRWCIVNFG